MRSEYVWNLLPWEQAVLWIGAVLVYVLCGGFAWALAPNRWSDWKYQPLRELSAIGWPVSLVVYIVYRIALIGPRTVTRIRDRNKLPRAEIYKAGNDDK